MSAATIRGTKNQDSAASPGEHSLPSPHKWSGNLKQKVVPFLYILLLLIWFTESVCWHVLSLDGCFNILFEHQSALRNTVCSANISFVGTDLQRSLGLVRVSGIVVKAKECTICAFWFVRCLLSVCWWFKKSAALVSAFLCFSSVCTKCQKIRFLLRTFRYQSEITELKQPNWSSFHESSTTQL